MVGVVVGGVVVGGVVWRTTPSWTSSTLTSERLTRAHTPLLSRAEKTLPVTVVRSARVPGSLVTVPSLLVASPGCHHAKLHGVVSSSQGGQIRTSGGAAQQLEVRVRGSITGLRMTFRW